MGLPNPTGGRPKGIPSIIKPADKDYLATILPDVESRLIRNLCKASFYHFVKTFWNQIISNDLIDNWHIKYLCDEAQTICERVFSGKPKEYDLIVNIPPGTSKSSIFSIMLPIWMWLRMPSCRTICASFTAELALSFSRKSKLLVLSELFERCFPEIKLLVHQQNLLVNNCKGERIAAGIQGNITGKHANLIVVDDPLNPGGVDGADLENANLWLRETLPTRTVNATVTPTIMIMQRLHLDDPTGNWLRRGNGNVGLKHICLPAEINEYTKVQPDELRKNYVDGLLDPFRLSKDTLETRRALLGEFGYACQYDQHPVPRSGKFFNTSLIKIVKLLPQDRQSMVKMCRFWDRAASANRGDYTVGVLMGKNANGEFFVLDVVRGQWDSAERDKRILQTAQLDGECVEIGFEKDPGAAGIDSALALTKTLAGYSIHSDPAVSMGSKQVRADPFSVQVNIGNVSIAHAQWNEAYLYELEAFPGRQDDQVDASSGAFRYISQVQNKLISIGTISFV